MNVGINEFLLKRKTIAFDFNFDREGKKKVYSPFTCLEDLKKKKKISHYKSDKAYYYSPHHPNRR